MDGTRTVDLNADLGEGFGAWSFGDDGGLLATITSANVACGFHGGDPLTLHRTVAAAVERGITIGAHVAYRDLAGFGRRFLDATHDELVADVLYQLAALDGVARTVGGRVRYLKPHGALYARIVDDPVHAEAVVEAVATYDRGLAVVGLPHSEVVRRASERGLPTAAEAFCDRTYTGTGALVSRRRADSLVTDPDVAAARALRMVTDGVVEGADGTLVALEPQTLCVHGDTPGAATIAERVRSALEDAGIAVTPFVPAG